MAKLTADAPDDDIYDDEDDGTAESEEDLSGTTPSTLSHSVVWGTDWTAGTIVDQLRRQTIALDPAFQRRDAWSDERKARFIESLMLGLPIPQLVLAENKTSKGKFIVIDGKQRLLSLSKFTGVGLNKDQTPLVLTGLKIRTDLNGLTFDEISKKVKYENLLSEFENQSIRTVVIRGWTNDETLYTIFHRLNTGSVPLSTQELRQALHPGPFLSFAAQFSEDSEPLKTLLNLSKPDFRMRDVELVVRHFAFAMRLNQYRGNLKKFLDDTCDQFNKRWQKEERGFRQIAAQMDEAINCANKIFTPLHAFRKWDGSRFEKAINRAIFDVVAMSLTSPTIRSAALKNKSEIVQMFKKLYSNRNFRDAIESTTKSKTAVRTRFSIWFKALGTVVGRKIAVGLPPE